MNINLIGANMIGFIIAKWQLCLGLIISLLLVIVIARSFNSYQAKREQNKIDTAKETVIEKTAEAEVIANTKVEIQEDVKNAQDNTDISNKRFTNSKLRNSSEFSGFDANKEYCSKYDDIGCQQWRKSQVR